MNVKDSITNLSLITLSAFLLWHFSNIWRYGEYLVGEPSIAIRSLETVALVFILIFGVSRYISDIRRSAKRR